MTRRAGAPEWDRTVLQIGERRLRMHALDIAPGWYELPLSIKILLENALRAGRVDDAQTLATWRPHDRPVASVAFEPSRVLLQDSTGIPALVDLAALRDAVVEHGGDPSVVEPAVPVDLVVDHSLVTEFAGRADAHALNVDAEFERNRERYAFLRWNQRSFDRLRVVPPDTGIVHQVNLERLATVVTAGARPDGTTVAHPDTLVGTDSHTTMVNGLGVLGWGVGGIEASAAVIGLNLSLAVPDVVGVALTGRLTEGVTATDLVLTLTATLRSHGVVADHLEFFGTGLGRLPLETRATVANMAPEYGSTVAMFPIDDRTLSYLRLTGRPRDQILLVEAYAKEQGLFHDPLRRTRYSSTVHVDLSAVEPSVAGPAHPHDRVPLDRAPASFERALWEATQAPGPGGGDASREVTITLADEEVVLRDGHVAIAAITSCTNTSNPSAMIAAGLLAKRAVERGLTSRPWVKTSLVPGSRTVADYLAAAGLLPYLERLGFHVAGFGCGTCGGKGGSLSPAVSDAVQKHGLALTAVLSGNRNFGGRIHPDCRFSYLASPPLVVAYALAGSLQVNVRSDPLGTDRDGRSVHLRDLWPADDEVERTVHRFVTPERFRSGHADIFVGDDRWNTLPIPTTPDGRFVWDPRSTTICRPPFLEHLSAVPEPPRDILGARALLVLGGSVSTDHISPTGPIPHGSPAGRHLTDRGVAPGAFGTYSSRRGNHEVMVRGTFTNPRLRNELTPELPGGVTRRLPDGPTESVFDASRSYARDGVPLIILAGAEYGVGSSRDWAAKGTALLGVRAVLAESFERIHRANLIGVGVVPLRLPVPFDRLGITGTERFDLTGLTPPASGAPEVTLPGALHVTATRSDGTNVDFDVDVLVETPAEHAQLIHGGILPLVWRRLVGASSADRSGR